MTVPPALDLSSTFTRFGIALGLGLLIGLQREQAKSKLGGIRTFPLITMLGAVAALLSLRFGGWMVAAGAISLAALVVMGNVARWQTDKPGTGLTTEVAVLLAYAVGAYVVVGYVSVAIAAGGLIAVLLHLKAYLHRLVERLGEADTRAIMLFVVIALVILPVLPNRTYDPLEVLNPREIWMMVVLIVGMSLAGYVAYVLFGQDAGTVLAGILGGLVSSTATTVSASRRAATNPAIVTGAALIIVIASTISLGRVLVELVVVQPSHLARTLPPLALVALTMAMLAAGLYLFVGRTETNGQPQSNPAELKSALIFAVLYAAIKLAVAAATQYLGKGGLYVVAILSGLTDMDAITLSTGQMVEQGQLEPQVGWRVVLLAGLANLAFKGGTAYVLAPRRLGITVGILFSVAAAVGITIWMAWPDAWVEQWLTPAPVSDP